MEQISVDLPRLWSPVDFAPLSSGTPGHGQHLFHPGDLAEQVPWLGFIPVSSCSAVLCLLFPGVFLSLAQPTGQARSWSLNLSPECLRGF